MAHNFTAFLTVFFKYFLIFIQLGIKMRGLELAKTLSVDNHVLKQ